jgi:gluconolactonase
MEQADLEPLVTLDRFRTLADGLDHPECVAVGPDGQLYAGGEAGQIYRLDETAAVQIAATGGFVLGLCLDAESRIYACDQFRHEVVRIDSQGVIEPYSSTIGIPNYPVFDAAGNLFVSDSGGWDEHNGDLFRITPAGATERLDVNVGSFPNGLALSPDGEWLYVVLSQAPGIARIPLVGGLPASDAELLVSLPGCVPDGIAVTDEGDLIIACYSPDTIYRYRLTSGNLDIVAHDPRRVILAAPTNVTFHGLARSELAVGSLGRWHVASAPMPFRGARLNYPSLV